MANLAILQADARSSARLSAALGDVHRVSAHDSWEELERALAHERVEGCLVDADHPDRDTTARIISRIRERHPGLAIIAYVESTQSDGYFDLGELGVDGVVSSATPQHRLRTDVDYAFSMARGERIARALEGHFPSPGPAAIAWAVAHASHDTSVDKLATALGHTPRELRDALSEAGLPAPAKILLWGRLLLAGARLGSDGRTVEEVAFSVGYATATSLARAMKVHTGLTPGQVSERGGIEAVRDALFAGRRSPPPAGGGLRKLAVLALTTFFFSCATPGQDPAAAGADAPRSPSTRSTATAFRVVDAVTDSQRELDVGVSRRGERPRALTTGSSR